MVQPWLANTFRSREIGLITVNLITKHVIVNHSMVFGWVWVSHTSTSMTNTVYTQPRWHHTTRWQMAPLSVRKWSHSRGSWPTDVKTLTAIVFIFNPPSHWMIQFDVSETGVTPVMPWFPTVRMFTSDFWSALGYECWPNQRFLAVFATCQGVNAHASSSLHAWDWSWQTWIMICS